MPIKKLLVSLVLPLALLGPALASTEGIAWDKFPAERLTNMPALQRGAKLFVNYCLNCHAAAYMRFNRMRDIGLSEDQIRDNLVFTGVKVGDTMTVAMDPKDAKAWFGGVPPDLSLVARSRSDPAKGTGADYLYTYLRSYYRDETKATGWNNAAFPGVGMPHVLWKLQGPQRAVWAEEEDPHEHGRKVEVLKRLEPIAPGTMTAAEYNDAVADLVAFLQWMSEPAQGSRVRIGVWVLVFLGLFTVIAWRLNAAYWKDVR